MSYFYNDETSTPRFGRIIGWFVGAILLLWLIFAGTVSVDTGEIAVMTRFGRVTGQELGEGFHVKNPLDRANKYDIKVQRSNAKAAAASKDLQDVHADLVLNYSLEPGQVSDIHQKVGTTWEDKLVEPAIQEVFKASTAKYAARELITERAMVKANAVNLLRDRLAPYGVRVVDLSLTNFGFSPAFTQAIEAKQVAAQDAERAKFRLEEAKTNAQAQKVQGASLTEIYLMQQFLEKWNGVLPQYMGGGGEDGGLGFLLNLAPKQQ